MKKKRKGNKRTHVTTQRMATRSQTLHVYKQLLRNGRNYSGYNVHEYMSDEYAISLQDGDREIDRYGAD